MSSVIMDVFLIMRKLGYSSIVIDAYLTESEAARAISALAEGLADKIGRGRGGVEEVRYYPASGRPNRVAICEWDSGSHCVEETVSFNIMRLPVKSSALDALADQAE